MMRRTTPVAPAFPFAEDLRELQRRLAPQTVGCLYADDLSHIPLHEFLRGGSRVWVIDWRPRRPSDAVGSSLVRKDGDGYACHACEGETDGRAVCANFVPPGAGNRVCGNFSLLEGIPPRCTRFAPGSQSRTLAGDGSLGRAACFETRVEALVARATTRAQALDLAFEECRRCAEMELTLDIPSSSLDLVISVLLPSRVAEEPFGQLNDLLTRRFGSRPPPERTATLTHLENRVRVELFHMQIDAHLRELHRLVEKRRRRVCFATEPVSATRDATGWGLQPGIPLVFALLDRYFTFDFETLPPESFLRAARSAGGRPHVVQAMLLTPRKRPAPWSSHPLGQNGSEGGAP